MTISMVSSVHFQGLSVRSSVLDMRSGLRVDEMGTVGSFLGTSAGRRHGGLSEDPPLSSLTPFMLCGLTTLVDLQCDVGADGDDRVGGDDAVVLLIGFGDEALLCVGQQLPFLRPHRDVQDLVGAGGLQGWCRRE